MSAPPPLHQNDERQPRRFGWRPPIPPDHIVAQVVLYTIIYLVIVLLGYGWLVALLLTILAYIAVAYLWRWRGGTGA